MAFKYSMLVIGVMTVFGMSETNQKSDNKQDQSVDYPNKYFIATVFSGSSKGIVLGHDPLGIEFGFLLGLSDILNKEHTSVSAYYYYEDTVLVDQELNESVFENTFDYDKSNSINIYITKRLFKKETINRKYALYSGFEFSRDESSFKYTSLGMYAGSGNPNKVEYESINLDDYFGVLLGFKFEYRFLKKLSFEIDYALAVKYEIDQYTFKRSYYNSETMLITTYLQSLETTYRMNYDLESPRLIFKYYF